MCWFCLLFANVLSPCFKAPNKSFSRSLSLYHSQGRPGSHSQSQLELIISLLFSHHHNCIFSDIKYIASFFLISILIEKLWYSELPTIVIHMVHKPATFKPHSVKVSHILLFGWLSGLSQSTRMLVVLNLYLLGYQYSI